MTDTQRGNETVSRDKYLECYKVEQERYHNSLGYLHSHLKYYYSVIAAITVGTYWIWNATTIEIGKSVILIAGGFAIIFFAFVGLKLVESGYRHWLETISTLAKYEETLGFHELRVESRLWPNEPMVFPRYQKDLSCSPNSTSFVEDGMKKGTMKFMRRGFYAIMILSALPILFAIYNIIQVLASCAH